LLGGGKEATVPRKVCEQCPLYDHSTQSSVSTWQSSDGAAE